MKFKKSQYTIIKYKKNVGCTIEILICWWGGGGGGGGRVHKYFPIFQKNHVWVVSLQLASLATCQVLFCLHANI